MTDVPFRPFETALDEENALSHLRAAVSEEAEAVGVRIDGLDCSCFDGVYVTGLGGDYLTELAQKRDVLPTV